MKLLYLLICLTFYVKQVAALDVVLVNPSVKEDPFWQRVTNVTKSMANDLNINLSINYSDGHRILQVNRIQAIANLQKKPDYVIFMPYGGSVLKSFQTLEDAKIPFVTVEQVYYNKNKQVVGLPQQKFKYWLGEMFHDNFAASQKLTQSLVSHASTIKRGNLGLQAVGFGGDFYEESVQRSAGFEQVINDTEHVLLTQIVPTKWRRDLAKEKFKKLVKKYGHSEIVWAASDVMALGVVDATKEMSLTVNKDVFIGGFDWVPEALESIKKNEMTASVGGHFLMAAWALAKIYDHHKGYNVFTIGDTVAHIEMQVIDKSNIESFLCLVEDNDFSAVDFSIFSLSHPKNKGKKVNEIFSIERFINQLNLSKSKI